MFYDLSSDMPALKVKTADTTKVNTYNVMISVKYGEAFTNTDELEITIELTDPCVLAELTISPSILTTNTIEYYLGDREDEQFIQDSDVSSTVVDSSICPDIAFEVVNSSDLSPLDSSAVSFDAETHILTTNSTDLSQHGTELKLQLRAKYEGNAY